MKTGAESRYLRFLQSNPSEIDRLFKELLIGVTSFFRDPEAFDSLARRLIYELEVHQAELELQNEELRRAQQEIEELHERYFQLYDLAPVAYLALDAEGRILESNLAAAVLIGTTRQQLAERRLDGFIVRTDTDRFDEHLRLVIGQPGVRHAIELRLLRKDRSVRVVKLESVMLGAARTRCFSALIDVTGSRQAEVELRGSEERLRAILNTAVDAVITLDDQGLIESCNPATERLFGWAAGDLVNRSIGRLLPGTAGPGSSVNLGGAHPSLAAPSEPRALTGRRSDGTLIAVELTLGELYGEGRRFVAVIRDVTERHRTDEALRESLSRFEQIAACIDDVFYVADARAARFLYVSPACMALLGRSPGYLREGFGRWVECVHDDDRPQVWRALKRAGEGVELDHEYRVIRPSGEVRRVRERIFDGEELGRFTGIVQDVTDERRLEVELRQAQRLEALGTLSSGIAHDFNNLLMGLAGFAHLALDRLAHDHPARAYIERSREAISRGAALTRRLLLFSDKRRAAPASVEIDVVTRAARDLLAPLLGDHIRVQVDTGAPGLRVRVEPGNLEQMLLNLASNARDAMPDGGKLTIRTFPLEETSSHVAGREVALSVSDTGVGMDDAVRARIFEPFFTTKEVGRGTGLGLSTVFGFMRDLGGNIDVESAPERGTTFTLRFPVVLETTEAKRNSDPPPLRGGEMVLVVDDDAMVRGTIESYLSAIGCEPILADSADAAEMIVARADFSIDVLLTDVMMPGRLGGDLANALRALRPSLRVLIMSAHPRDELLRLGRFDVEAHFLSKPFDQHALEMALRELLADRPEPLPAPTHPLRILIVDDDPDIRDLTAELLRNKGHDVRVAAEGSAAVATARELHPELVLCDLNLGSGMSGYDVGRALRGDPSCDKARLVAITGCLGEQERAGATAAGFDLVLMKPVEPETIERLVGH